MVKPEDRRALHVLAVVALMAAVPGGCGGSPTRPGPLPPGPTLTCPSPVRAVLKGDEAPAITFDSPVVQGGVAPVSITCMPPSGTTFTVGTTSVTCTATDANARSGSCAFDVVVERPPTLTAVKFLAFGDSVTAGTLSRPCTSSAPADATAWMLLALDIPESYPAKLQNLLAARYVAQTVGVVNEGWPGEPAVGAGEERLPEMLEDHRPEVLLLLHGFNDLFAAGRSRTFDTSVPRIAGALEDMVDTAKSRRVRVLLATLPALDAGGCRGAGAPGVTALNDLIRGIAADEGVGLVDLYVQLGGTPDGIIGIDGLHPTESGYTQIAQVWFEAIQRDFERRDAPSPTLDVRR